MEDLPIKAPPMARPAMAAPAAGQPTSSTSAAPPAAPPMTAPAAPPAAPAADIGQPAPAALAEPSAVADDDDALDLDESERGQPPVVVLPPAARDIRYPAVGSGQPSSSTVAGPAGKRQPPVGGKPAADAGKGQPAGQPPAPGQADPALPEADLWAAYSAPLEAAEGHAIAPRATWAQERGKGDGQPGEFRERRWAGLCLGQPANCREGPTERDLRPVDYRGDQPVWLAGGTPGYKVWVGDLPVHCDRATVLGWIQDSPGLGLPFIRDRPVGLHLDLLQRASQDGTGRMIFRVGTVEAAYALYNAAWRWWARVPSGQARGKDRRQWRWCSVKFFT